MSGPQIWLNDRLIAAEKARLSPLDRGFLIGEGIFETLAVYDGIPFAFSRHYLRMRAAAGRLGLRVPTESSLLDWSSSVLEANDYCQPATTARLRISLSSGESPLGPARSEEAKDTLLITAGPVGEFPESAILWISPHTRNERSPLAGLKSLSYGENAIALQDAQRAGATEALFCNTRGELCEGTATNLFLEYPDGKIATPPVSSGCLPGVTRALVLEILGATMGRKINETLLAVSELDRAAGLFLSSSLREIQPVSQVFGKKNYPLDPHGTVAELLRHYGELRRENPNP